MYFTITIPVQFRDLDCMGHVNNAVYFSYMEQARIEFCAQFPEIDFRNPKNRTGKSLILANISNSSFDIAYELRLANTQTIVATGKSVQVYYDYAAGKSLPLPEKLRKLLEGA